jgi:membrane-bound ClpP family serine protease
MIPLLMVLTIDGPLHEIHREMVANAFRQGASQVFVVARGPDAPTEVATRLTGATVVEQAPANVSPYNPTIRERIVCAVLKPERAFLALVIGMLFIYAEFCFPGTVLPGACGGVLAMVALYGLSASRLRTPGVLLLLIATCLFIASAFLKPHVAIGIGAAVAMCAGAILLVDAPTEFRIRPVTAAGITLPFALVTLLLTGIAQRARTNKFPEQNRLVVFSSPKDILSTISGESGEQVRNAAARRT